MSRALILSIILLAVVAHAGLQVRIEGVPDTLFIGDPFNAQLTITPPGPGRLIFPDWKEALDKFDLLTTPDSTVIIIQVHGQPLIIPLQTTCYEAGEQVFQPITVTWISTDGAQVDSAETEPILVHVQGIIPDSIKALADTTQKAYKLLAPNRIKKLGYSFAEFIPWILALVVAVAAFFGLRWWWRKRKSRQAMPEEAIVPTRPAHEIALEELDKLRDARLYQSGKLKEYYSTLSEIIRRYIEARYAIPAMESTSFQLLRDVETVIADSNLRQQLQYLLDDADLVKFAKQKPDEESCQKDLEKGYILVRKTMPEAPQPLEVAA